ncbi:MAG: M56 family metallopeptidase [Pyrinomonadaceae bacterium]
MYFLVGICLVFAFLLTLNLFASLTASALWRVISKPAKRLSFRRQEQIIFALRAFPVAAAVIFVLAFVIPGYILFEPHSTDEVVTLELGLVAFASFIGIAIALFRVFRSWLATQRLSANWLENSEKIAVDEVNIPVYRFRHPFPVIAVVGMLRPRMFVASQIFDSLSEDEFRAAVAHEYGHLSAHDNFKRAFLRVCRDMLILPIGRELDRAWTDNTESAADEFAANVGGNRMALDLAETLIKIARIAPANTAPAMPLGSFLIDGRQDNLSQRVKRLLKLSENKTLSANASLLRSRRSMWVYSSLIFVSVLLLASNKDLLFAIHNVSENIVGILQ